ncbi:VapE domain-containing protein [Methylophaga sp.]|uniref:VapE domain-containing protein n=1 Tax=Methylophaga sp. TaxID=2024840 RepID=UPI003A90EC98
MTQSFIDLAMQYGPEAVAASIRAQLEKNEKKLKQQIKQHEVPDTPDQPAAELWQKRLMRNDRGVIQNHAFNILQILDNDPAWKDVLAYCDFSYRIIKRKLPGVKDFKLGEWDDGDTARLGIWLTSRHKFKPGRGEMLDALLTSSQSRRFHPVREYLQSVKWDGVSRIDNWLEGCFGAKAKAGSKYLQLVSRYFMISAVARIMLPLKTDDVNKVDTVLILEGNQGIKKSTAVKTLFGEWFSDAPIPIGDKDAYQNITGVWGVEMAELDAFNKAENTAAKMFFSQQRDRYRPSYGMFAQDFPRQCVFVGTTNQDEYLKDYTGNRRYWPVMCTKVNIQALADFRDLLWAEAFHAYQSGERWWVDGAEEDALFESEQDDRMQADPWESMLQDYLDTATDEYFTAADLLLNCIKLDGGHMTRAHQNRLSPIMKSLGWKNERRWIITGVSAQKVQRRVYVRPVKNEAPF